MDDRSVDIKVAKNNEKKAHLVIMNSFNCFCVREKCCAERMGFEEE